MTECTCPRDVALAFKSHLEGHAIEPCEQHRPAHLQPGAPDLMPPPALNSDALTTSLMTALGATNSGAEL
ncbi:hypothetical protein [Pedococcus sp. 2YAF34]|uniref:hypothetical protein n=1 Tax=Pedococcus sp. 2YAF34 TaxID=3233032 RepID=UPI003F9D3B53